MPLRFRALAGVLFAIAVPASAQDMKLTYPETRKTDLVETRFGAAVADPYRWLENDVRNDPEVADWVKRQNAVSQAYLSKLPQRAWFAGRMSDEEAVADMAARFAALCAVWEGV